MSVSGISEFVPLRYARDRMSTTTASRLVCTLFRSRTVVGLAQIFGFSEAIDKGL